MRERARFEVTSEALAATSMMDLVTDWYCLRQAGALALPFIPDERLALYRSLIDRLPVSLPSLPPHSTGAFLHAFLQGLRHWMERAGAMTDSRSS